MRRRSQLILAILGAVAALAVVATIPGSAGARSSAANSVIADCVAHAQLTRSYPISALKAALQSLSAETREYSDCQDVIQRALNAAISHQPEVTGPTSGGGGSFLPTPVIVVLVVLILAALTLGAVAIRRRRGVGGDDGTP